ncbi:MAG: DegT/DnrJ/EryC1/StrS family aminotransferase [Gammaproteobacteria bacterium]|nr:DegT/DnrJ/EryC1/StrS family aminotransferase [Gammaproteobacteria bacterium]
MQFIDLKAQQKRIRPQINEAIKKVLDHGCYIMGPEVGQLESLLAEFIGVRHAIGCSSGTDALLLPLLAYGVGPGVAIFTTPFSFFASCEVIALTGATPVFVDIEPVSFNIDPAKLQAAIEVVKKDDKLKPKVIMPVDLFGQPADYDPIMQIAEVNGLFVLEDAAQAFGATYKSRRAPSLGHVGATSFFPAKPLGCYGDGGAIFTDDDQLAETMRSLLVHGKGKDKYNNVRIGLNARLDTIQAAILIEKMKIFVEEIELRQQVANRYTEAIALAVEGSFKITPPITRKDCTSVWAQYTISCDRRDDLQARFKHERIPSMIYYQKPIHLLDAMTYLGHQCGDFPVAEKAAHSVLALPFHPYLDPDDQSRIISVMCE